MKTLKIVVDLKIANWPITGTIDCELTPCPLQSPIFGSIVGQKGPSQVITFTAPVSNLDPTATSVPSTASFDDGSPPQTFDAFPAANGTFTTANPGVVITLVGTQVNSAGTSPQGAPVNFLAAVGVCPPITPAPPAIPVAPIFTQIIGV